MTSPATFLFMPESAYGPTNNCVGIGHELLRRVECLAGTVEIDVLFDPRPDYGRVVPSLIDQKAFGVVCEHRAQVLVLQSES